MVEISVVMCVYNEKTDWLDMSIKSIINQTYKSLELIIINDNPDDNKIIDFLKNISRQDNRIRVFYNSENKGLTSSLNFALNKCRGQYIVRMDADDISKVDRIEKQLGFLINNGCDFIYSNVDLIDEDSQIINIGKQLLLNTLELKEISRYGNPSKHPTWFLKKSVYLELQGYRNIPFIEDYDFFLRALINNFKIMQMDYNVLFYRYRNNSISRENALPQFLMTNLIKKMYSTNIILEDKKVEDKCRREISKVTDYDSKIYSNLLKKRDQGINQLKNKNIFKGIRNIMMSSLLNKYVFVNTINIFRYKIHYRNIRRKLNIK